MAVVVIETKKKKKTPSFNLRNRIIISPTAPMWSKARQYSGPLVKLASLALASTKRHDNECGWRELDWGRGYEGRPLIKREQLVPRYQQGHQPF